MNTNLVLISIVIPDYDDAINYYTNVIGFDLVEDTVMSPTKRWVRVKPKGDHQMSILLAKAKNEAEESRIGNQTGGRVFLFLHTDHINREIARLNSHKVEFIRSLVEEEWGKVAVFKDKYGNLWDLIEPADQ